jgi:hypothetical protein
MATKHKSRMATQAEPQPKGTSKGEALSQQIVRITPYIKQSFL